MWERESVCVLSALRQRENMFNCPGNKKLASSRKHLFVLTTTFFKRKEMETFFDAKQLKQWKWMESKNRSGLPMYGRTQSKC